MSTRHGYSQRAYTRDGKLSSGGQRPIHRVHFFISSNEFSYFLIDFYFLFASFPAKMVTPDRDIIGGGVLAGKRRLESDENTDPKRQILGFQ